MSKDNCHSVQVPGFGTNRSNRLLESLLPDYAAVDERKIEDLKKFAQQIASQIKFKTESGWNGDWQAFFEKSIDPEQRTDPHYALFLAFLQNFQLATQDLNSLSKKHLDFFYRDVLRLKEKSAEPDQAYLILTLAKQVGEYLLPKKSAFKAGKDDTNVEVLFQNQSDQALNKSEVSSIKALFKDQFGRLYASPIANSGDRIGGDVPETEGRWSPFGTPKTLYPNSDRKLAVLGFAVSSPTLLLGEGLRNITTSITLQPQNGLLQKLKSLPLNSSFRFWLSGEKEWILAHPGFKLDSIEEQEQNFLDFLNKAETWKDISGIESQEGPVFDNPELGTHLPFQGYDIGESTAKNILDKRKSLPGEKFTSPGQVRSVVGIGEDKMADLLYSFQTRMHEIKDLGEQGIQLILRCHLIPDQEAVLGYSEEVLLQRFETTQPILKIELTETNQSFAYPIIQGTKVSQVDLEVDVVGVENLILQNDQSGLPIGKNIHPFGFRPVLGSNFYLGSKEIFSKALSSIKIHTEWHGLPQGNKGFEDHYNGYDGSLNNGSFKVDAYLLDDKSWESIKKNIPLFSNSGTLSPLQTYKLEPSDLGKIDAEPELNDFASWTPSAKRGFLKLSLSGKSFGHSEFPKIFSAAVINLSKTPPPTGTTIPNEPYSPEIKSVKIDYSASDSFVPGLGQWNSFFHIGAFGEAKIDKAPDLLLPDYSQEGYLLIGLKNHQISQSIQLLVHVLDGSGNPEKDVPEVKWSFLSGNEWIDFGKLDLVLDETKGLIQTGLIGFTLPRAADNKHTILQDGLTWIRASVNKNSDAIPDFTQVLAQGIRVVFEDKGNDPKRLEAALPAKSISKLKFSLPPISKIDQPFSSFDGKTQEASEDFYQRISERLRHKQRAVSRWDYEHLVLEQFSEIYQVKVLNHTEYSGNLEEYRAMAPRHVTVVTVANVQNKNALDPLRPKASVSLISGVEDFLKSITSAGVFLHVVNPIYEELQVKTKVKFLPGIDQSVFAKKLEDELKSFLSPWGFENVENFNFSGEIHGSVILHFIEKRPYVDFLTCFELYHIIKNPIDGSVISKEKVEEAKGSTGVSLLGSIGKIETYGDHLIEILETEACDCMDNEIMPTAKIASSESSDMDEAFPT
jgi:hypothetical protein